MEVGGAARKEGVEFPCPTLHQTFLNYNHGLYFLYCRQILNMCGGTLVTHRALVDVSYFLGLFCDMSAVLHCCNAALYDRKLWV